MSAARSRRSAPRTRQRGIALLTAIILVAIATIVATAIGWQSQLSARRGIAVFTVEQSLALAEGAEAIAAFALSQNRQKNPQLIAPSQVWAQPFGPTEFAPGAVLEARLEDLSGRFNLNSVVTQPKGGGPLSVDPVGKAEFEYLLQMLQIDTTYAARLIDWIDADNQPTFPGGAEDSFYMALSPPYRPPNMPITSISELLAMGMDRVSYDKLKNLVTALPPGTPVNVCTAPGEVLDALGQTTSYSTSPQQTLAQRQQYSCFPDVATFLAGVSPTQKGLVQGRVGTTSQYFRLRTWITIGTTRFTLYSLINQTPSGQIRPLIRTFGTE